VVRQKTKEYPVRTRKLYEILNQAIVDKAFRDSLFRNGRQAVEEWDLTKEERAYLKWLPYEKFEQTVGSVVSHYLVPLPVNESYLILPELASSVPPKGLTPIRLTESLIFGNGTHATSALCLAALDDHLQARDTVLDFGTGSGILSIAAALQGARRVVALDIDPASVETARKNAALNSVELVVHVKQGSLEEAELISAGIGGFDLVLVNILTPVILELLETGLVEILKPGAVLVTSGIETNEVKIVERAVIKAGLIDIVCRELNGWAAVIARKP
jgi:ribosomal protein L11 methyltransferase